MNNRFFWFNLNRVQPPQRGEKLPPGKHSRRQRGRSGQIRAGSAIRVFRRAVSMAIDRDAMIRSMFFGEGAKNWAITGPGNKVWHTPDMPGYDYNVASRSGCWRASGSRTATATACSKMRAAIRSAFQLKTNGDNTMRVATANFIQDDLAKVGIRVILSPVDFNTLITNLQNDLPVRGHPAGQSERRAADPANAQNFLRSSGLSHYFFVKQQKPDAEEARIDQLMDKLVTTLDMRQRKASGKRSRPSGTSRDGWSGCRFSSEASCQQPLRQRAAERSGASHPLEHRQGIRQMMCHRLLIVGLVIGRHGRGRLPPHGERVR